MQEFHITTNDKTRPRSAKSVFKSSFAIVLAIVLGVVILCSIPVVGIAYAYYSVKSAVSGTIDSLEESTAELNELGRKAVEPHLRKAKFPEVGTDIGVTTFTFSNRQPNSTHNVAGSCRSFDGKTTAKFYAEFVVSEFGPNVVWKLTHLEIDERQLFPKRTEPPAE